MQKFRIMVRSEDNMLFCAENDVKDEHLDEAFDNAHSDYPCAQIWVEEEGSYFGLAD